MILRLDLDEAGVARHALQVLKLAYRKEAELIGTEEFPPLQETEASLKLCGDVFLGFYEGETLAGVLSYQVKSEVLFIHRLAVDPVFFRRGIATKLLGEVLKAEGIKNWVVSTAKSNLPAIRCYEKSGFCVTGERNTSEGITLVFMRKG
jgi:ribosomal protein S18 acetylase RimI-like enzyme